MRLLRSARDDPPPSPDSLSPPAWPIAVVPDTADPGCWAARADLAGAATRRTLGALARPSR